MIRLSTNSSRAVWAKLTRQTVEEAILWCSLQPITKTIFVGAGETGWQGSPRQVSAFFRFKRTNMQARRRRCPWLRKPV